MRIQSRISVLQLINGLYNMTKNSFRAVLLFPLLMSFLLIANAHGQDPGPLPDLPGTGEHDLLMIDTIYVATDGFDNYYIAGSVIGCDNLVGLPVTLGGAVSMTLTTGIDGCFYTIVHVDDGSGWMLTVYATCPHGHTTPIMVTNLP